MLAGLVSCHRVPSGPSPEPAARVRRPGVVGGGVTPRTIRAARDGAGAGHSGSPAGSTTRVDAGPSSRGGPVGTGSSGGGVGVGTVRARATPVEVVGAVPGIELLRGLLHALDAVALLVEHTALLVRLGAEPIRLRGLRPGLLLGRARPVFLLTGGGVLALEV